MTQTFAVKLAFGISLPSSARPDMKAILLPSLNQGSTFWFGLVPPRMIATGPIAARLVKCVGDEPSAFMIQTLGVLLVFWLSLPSRSRVDTKAILLPSGEIEGKRLTALVSLVNDFGLSGKTVGSTDQILVMPGASPVRAALMLYNTLLPFGNQE